MLVTDMNSRHHATKWILLMATFTPFERRSVVGGCVSSHVRQRSWRQTRSSRARRLPGCQLCLHWESNWPTAALDHAMTINLIPVSNQLGAVFSNYLAGTTSDKLGRKPVIEGCLLGGVLSYVLMFVAGAVLQNYWAFFANFVNGLFSGIRGVISAYLQDIHEPVEFMTKVMPTMINFFLFGAMVARYWAWCGWPSPTQTRRARHTHGSVRPVLIGVALSTGMTYGARTALSQPKKAASDADSKEDKPPPPPMTPMAKKIITVIPSPAH